MTLGFEDGSVQGFAGCGLIPELQVGCSFPGWLLELREHLCGRH